MGNLKYSFITSLLLASAECLAVERVHTFFYAKAGIQPSCMISARDITFGDYNPQFDSNTVSTVDVVCSNGTEYVVHLSGGSDNPGLVDRFLIHEDLNDRSGSTVSINDKIPYTVSLNPTGIPVFFNGSDGTGFIQGVGLGSSASDGINTQTYILYSNIKSGLYVNTGRFVDDLKLHLLY